MLFRFIAVGRSTISPFAGPEAQLFAWVGLSGYPAARVDHRVADGDSVRVGPLEVTAHITANAPWCTTWSFTVRDRDRDLRVVHRCRLEVPGTLRREDAARYASRRAEFERGFSALRALPVDIWLTPQGREYGRYRKYQQSLSATDPVAPFIDREGYLRAIDDAEARLRAALD